MNHADPKNPKRNSHPVKRYEVIATSDAPGPWDSVKGYISYEVVNPECTPEDKFLGVHVLPQGVGHDVEMTRLDEKTWKGQFYRDFLLDEDYFGLGVCHWSPTSIGGAFVIHGETFGSGALFGDLLKKDVQAEYFKKSEYWDKTLSGDQALVSTAATPDVIQKPDAFFTIKVSVRELTP